MKLIFLLILIGGGIVFYPMFKEGAAGQCDAVERLAVRVGAEHGIPTAVLQMFTGGKLADLLVRGQYPDRPPGVACGVVYWKATFDPKGLENEALRLKR